MKVEYISLFCKITLWRKFKNSDSKGRFVYINATFLLTLLKNLQTF